MIIDFLDLDLPKDELATALKVLRAFKQCESIEEYLLGSFSGWVKLEQFEELLAHRVEGTPLKPDTLEFMERLKRERGRQP
jgi:hypothetical protein